MNIIMIPTYFLKMKINVDIELDLVKFIKLSGKIYRQIDRQMD